MAAARSLASSGSCSQDLGLNLGQRATVDATLGEFAERLGAGTGLAEAARLHLMRLLVVLGRSQQAQYPLSRVIAVTRFWCSGQTYVRRHALDSVEDNV